jgi:hypothetical protein
MLRKAALTLAIGAGLLGASSARASAQGIVGRVYVGVPPVVVEVGPPPGPGYVWVPEYRRWELGPAYPVYPGYYRGRGWRAYERPYVERRGYRR